MSFRYEELTIARKYGREDHRKAFEMYFESPVMKRISDALGTSYQTIHRWAREDFTCPHGCPWHGWEALKTERQNALDAKLKLLSEGDVDPVSHQHAMANPEKISGSVQAMQDVVRIDPKEHAVMESLQTDLQRIVQWEFVYAKAYYDLTGISLNYMQAKDKQLDPKSLYAMGLHAASMDGAIRALSAAQKEIDKLRNRIEADKKPGSSQAKPEAGQISIDELRLLAKKVASGEIVIEEEELSTEQIA